MFGFKSKKKLRDNSQSGVIAKANSTVKGGIVINNNGDDSVEEASQFDAIVRQLERLHTKVDGNMKEIERRLDHIDKTSISRDYKISMLMKAISIYVENNGVKPEIKNVVKTLLRDEN